MSLPPVTTAQQPNALITTTIVNLTNSHQTSPPALRTRPPGWHAKSFGFDWNKRSDHHKYCVTSGLPEVHAAIVNDDWDLALELICSKDFGLLWLPPVSQSVPKNGGTRLDAGAWAVNLLSQNEKIHNDAILGMTYHYHDVTYTGENCLYGANLLTLCLLKPARPDVLQHVINLAANESPNYLNLPDAVGRTPLWIAITNDAQASIHLLLKAGADPLQACKFSAQGTPKSPLSIATKHTDKEIFRNLLLATINQGKKFTPYDYSKDPLCLKLWASSQSSDVVLWLADQVEALRGPLLCCEDISGSSVFFRSVIGGSLDNMIANGNEDLIEWLRKLDTSTTVSEDIESSPLYAAASLLPIATFKSLYDFFKACTKETSSTKKLKQALDKFLVSKTINDYDPYLDGIPEITEKQKSSIKKNFVNAQFKFLSSNSLTIAWDDYTRTVQSIWPFISEDEKNVLIKEAVFISNDHKDLVLSLLDCELKESTLHEILKLSSHVQNKTAFEFAAERSIESHTILNSLTEGKDVGQDMMMRALYAGSLQWIEKLIDAGFDLQVIADRPGFIIQLADIDPHGIAKKLKGMDVQITSVWIEITKTEAGKQALTALMNKATNHC